MWLEKSEEELEFLQTRSEREQGARSCMPLLVISGTFYSKELSRMSLNLTATWRG